MKKHRVDLVLTGHKHHYERFRALRGVTYVVSGGAGGRLTRVGRGPRTSVRVPAHHFLALQIEPQKLALRAIDIEGAVIDQLALERR